MNPSEFPSIQQSSAAIEAEAAAWLARLHGPNRTSKVDRGLRRWLNLSPEHQQAFERATEVWEKLALVRRRPLERVADWERGGVWLTFGRAVLATVLVVALTVAATAWYYSSNSVIATAVGEQRTLTLEDGSRVTLNTKTRLRVNYSKKFRRIDLQGGEALFEVASNSNRPFIVMAGNREIKALGTSFVVRRGDFDLTVTLVDGKVSVTPAGPIHAPQEIQQAQVLAPGQRITFHRQLAPQLDTPRVDKVTAWEHGQVAFDDTPLTEALSEMNRYNQVPLTIANPEAAALRISGVFRATESVEFARAIARTYSLRVVESGGEIMLTGVPRVPSSAEHPEHSR